MLCIVSKYHLQDSYKKYKKQQKKTNNIYVTLHHAAHRRLFVGPSQLGSPTSQTIRLMSYLFVVKSERGHDLPGPDVQI